MPKDVSSKMVASSQDLGSPVTSGTLTVQQFEEGARAFATQAWPSLELRLLLGSSASTPGNATGTKQSLDTQQLKQHEESIAQEAACTTDGSRRADAVLPKAVIASQWQVVDITACAPSINPLLGRQQALYLCMADLPLPLTLPPLQQQQQQQPTPAGPAGWAAAVEMSGHQLLSAAEVGNRDEAMAEATAENQATKYGSLDLHIVWHPSYQVPTLMMRPKAPGGAPVVLDALLSALPGAHSCAKQAGADWAFVAPQEHPVLQGGLGRTGWYMLHPCQTAPVLSLLLKSHNDGEDVLSQDLEEQNAREGSAGEGGAETGTPSKQSSSGSGKEATTCSGSQRGGGTGDVRAESDDSWLVRYFVAWFGSIVAPVLGIALQPLGANFMSSCSVSQM